MILNIFASVFCLFLQAEKSFPRLLAAVPEAADAEPSLDHALTLQNRMTMALRENRLTPSLTEDYITAVAALCEASVFF